MVPIVQHSYLGGPLQSCHLYLSFTSVCSSTTNTRIERPWVEVGSQFARQWRAFFMRLERIHCLNADDPDHLWLLHFLFLDDLNRDCQQFVNEWNHHPISGRGRDQTPSVSHPGPFARCSSDHFLYTGYAILRHGFAR